MLLLATPVFFAAFFFVFGLLCQKSLFSKPPLQFKWKPRIRREDGPGDESRKTQNIQKDQKLQQYKLLYYKLHNLEQYPSVLHVARDTLLSMFSEVVEHAISVDSDILCIQQFHPDTLTTFIHDQDDSTAQRFEEYIKRRESGGPRELFESFDTAKEWLISRAPAKYVDGAWLGNIHRVSTPFHLRAITKNAWQVLSEELGDGDLSKNHVHVYQKLMDSLHAGLPDADSIDFIKASLGMSELQVWKCATAQLLISLFPHEYLPEILGFNMHFECLTWETLLAARELRELRINDDYFLLHISIDNGDSGHTAMATKIVIDYLNHIRAREGEDALQQTWKRVQVGYLLSAMSGAPRPTTGKPRYQNSYSGELLRIFKAKSSVSQKLHCGSKVKIGSKRLSDWLSAETFTSPAMQDEFLEALSQAKPWIRICDGVGSRLVKELSWSGKMFGAFTGSEIAVLENWINALGDPSPPPDAYTQFIGRGNTSFNAKKAPHDIRVDYPVLSPAPPSILSMIQPIQTDPSQFPSFATDFPVNFELLLPLWFAHASLLENFVSVPFFTCTLQGAAVVKALRAQYGLMEEKGCVDGLDEMNRVGCTGIIELGIEMMHNTTKDQPEGLHSVIECTGDDDSAGAMLQLSMHPRKHGDRLVGMAWAFVSLHEQLGMTDPESRILSSESKLQLLGIAKRERAALGVYLRELLGSSDRYRLSAFLSGCEKATNMISQCFKESG